MNKLPTVLGTLFCTVLLLSALDGRANPASEPNHPFPQPIWKTANHTIYGFLPYWTSANYSPEWAVLTHVSWFGESLSSTGTVSASHPLPSGLLGQAHANGVKVPLTITCFNSTSIDSVLANYMDTAVNNIFARMQNYGCDGVCIDFEGVRATNAINGISNKLLLQNFMEKLYAKCKTANSEYHVSLCAPAVDWSNVFRNNNLTNCLDAFLIMGYDYFWSGSGTTGPVAPLEGYTYDLTYTVNTYLNYLPGNKIVLLLPFYGFDWPCASDSAGAPTSSTGTAVVMKTAVANAQNYARKWHNASSTPWYAYQADGVWHQCWYDDTESLGIKFNLVFERQLQGTGMWALGYEVPSIWQVISQMFGGTLSLGGKKIAIDAGHGGGDTGATGIDGSGFPNEEDFNLDIALRVKELLSFAGATVTLTRATDADVSLQQRCDIANNANTDIFVSIHMNSATGTARGTETFYYANSDTDYSVEGKRLAQNVQAKVVSRLGTYDRGIKGDYPYFGYHLYVLAHTNMPAILTEVCFISNDTDFGMVSQYSKRTLAALAIYEGICAYFGVTPVYGNASLSVSFPQNNSSVTGTVKFGFAYVNAGLLTGCRWRIDSGGWNTAYAREWFFDTPQQAPVSFNTYSFSVGWKNLSFEVSDLWGNARTVLWSLFFTRNLAFEGKVWGSSSANNLTDDNDDNYAANNLGEYLYIALKCNHTIRAVKTHWWDGDNRYYQYKIEVSRDNETWMEVVNKTSGEYRGWQWDQIDTPARFLRITGTYNSANQWYHIKELQIFGRLETPYSVYGYVLDAATGDPVFNATITVTNIANNENLSITTDEFGYYEAELNDLHSTTTDEIRITLRDFGLISSFIVDDRNTSTEVSFTVAITSEPPVLPSLLLFFTVCSLFYTFRKK
ncbi:MAG: N-acetylmuramoyl-L-alanine amidase [Thermoplasmata archaeon]|nr:N-acetylmuramoyl-L-alanine amidase [Thermoplasmata archaeon]